MLGIGLWLAAVLVPLTLYLRTMPPTITWWFGGSDSGELVSAADSLGIAHPTGYPLFVLLGHVASRVPFGEVAARVNAMNAILGSLGTAGIALTVVTLADDLAARRVVRWVAGLLAALAVGTSSLYWSQAIIGEVYILQAALTSLILFVWSRPAVHPTVRGAAHGLALTNHLTGVIILGAALVTVAQPWDRPKWRATMWSGVGMGVTLLLYLLLPLRAAQDPIANWGDPDTPSRFLVHVTGWHYRGYLAWGDLPGSLRDLSALLRLTLEDLPPWTLPAAGMGLNHLWQTRRRFAWCTGLTVAGTFLFTAAYQVTDRAPHLFPAYVIAGVWCGLGLLVAARAAARWASSTVRWLVITAAAAGMLLSLAVWSIRTYNHVDLSGDDSALVFARATLDALPPNATYYTARDDVTFALWYAQRSLGMRRDVRIIDVRNASLRGVP